MHKLSIITINYNNADGLLATIKSVVNQTQKDFEFIIIDGGSTDNGAQVIKEHINNITYWCSEKDKGIYDAQNKGIAKAKGEYLLFLNSGDTFYSNTVIENFYNYLKEAQSDIIYANTNLLVLDKIQQIKKQPQQLSLDFWYKETVNHQSTFIKRDLFSQYGNYNTEYKICSDFDFFLKVYVNNPKAYSYFDLTLANYALDGFSSNPKNFPVFLEERETILKKRLTEEQYLKIKKNHIKTLPLKEQILQYIYERPTLKKAFNVVYKIYGKTKK